MSEAEIASLLALSGASFLASQLRFLAFSAIDLPLAPSLALPNRALDLSEVVVTWLLALSGALALASWLRAALALLISVDDVSGATVASLLAQNALALISWDSRGLAMWRVAIVLQLKTILTSPEAESRDLSLAFYDFAVHIVLAKPVLSLQETFVASRATLTCWREARLVSVKTVIDSNRVYYPRIRLS